jgi:hypothetical protein
MIPIKIIFIIYIINIQLQLDNKAYLVSVLRKIFYNYFKYFVLNILVVFVFAYKYSEFVDINCFVLS